MSEKNELFDWLFSKLRLKNNQVDNREGSLKQERIHSAGPTVHSTVTPTLQTVLSVLTVLKVLTVLNVLTVWTVLNVLTVLIVLTVLTVLTVLNVLTVLAVLTVLTVPTVLTIDCTDFIYCTDCTDLSNTRTSGAYGSLVLAPAEGLGALRAPCQFLNFTAHFTTNFTTNHYQYCHPPPPHDIFCT